MTRPLLLALVLSAAWSAAADAHGVGGVGGTPVPGFVFAWAAAAILAGSFFALGALWRTPRLDPDVRRRARQLPRAIEDGCGAIAVAGFLLLVAWGLAGTQDPEANPLPTAVYVWFWVVAVPVSALFGNVLSAFNPWRATARLAGSLSRRALGELGPPLIYPAWLGRWPAVVTLAGFAWLELVSPDRADPVTLAVLGLIYATVQLVGIAAFGAEQWTRRGDGFAVYFGLFGRLALLTRRPIMSAAARLDDVPGTTALLCVMIGSTSFDGFSGTTAWRELEPHLHDVLGSPQLLATLGLLTMIALVALVFRIGAPTRDRAAFAHSLIPIAAGYVVAHYATLVLDRGLHIAVNQTVAWIIQVSALVGGHIGALILAHDRALTLHTSPTAARRSQERMLVVMVAYTTLGLWLLSSLAR